MNVPLQAELKAVDNYDALAADWRRLEAHADGSPFTAWPWVSAWLHHLPQGITPLLFRAEDAEGLVALALLVDTRERGVRRIFGGRTLFVQETGDNDLDGITVEYAGLLTRRGREEAAYKALFAKLDGMPRWYKLRLSASGQAAAILAALPDSLRAFNVRERPSYFVDLAAVRAEGGDYLAKIGSNTRSGLRRTRRHYEARGPLRIEVATETQQALDWLDEVRLLHERYWRSKNKPGSFASAFFVAFHEHLVRENTRSGFTHLVRVMAGDLVVGYLYNLVWRGDVYFYNAGLNYGALDRKQDRPGFLALLLAIEKYQRDGLRNYDFLAG